LKNICLYKPTTLATDFCYMPYNFFTSGLYDPLEKALPTPLCNKSCSVRGLLALIFAGPGQRLVVSLRQGKNEMESNLYE